MDRFSKYTKISGALRSALADTDLVTTLHLADGTTQEIVHTRRAVAKKITRKRASTVIAYVDVDLDALDQVFPFETFTVADWPELFIDHVGLRVPQGVGTARKVPLAWISKSGGQWVFAGPKVIGTAGTVLTVYRGTQAGQGAIVDPSEYTVSTRTAPRGYQVVVIVFTKEQIDYDGKPYVIEADFSLPGDRAASAELARVLNAFSISTDAAYTTAANADTAAGFLVDTLYGGKGRTGRAIVGDLCAVARAWPIQSSTGAWSLAQDVAQAAVADYDARADLIEIEEYGEADLKKTVTVYYRPKASLSEEWSTPLQRPADGVSGDLALHYPYVYDHAVADRLASYWQARNRVGAEVGKGTVYAAQLTNGSVINVTEGNYWSGTKALIVLGVTRGADNNQATFRKYDAAVYTYVPGALPADATNGYAPDYSFTKPAAPTGVTAVSGGAAVASDGTMLSFELVRATPPAANWTTMRALAVNTTTLEEYSADLRLVSGNYEARITGMRPGQAHTVTVLAINANNIEGTPSAAVPFTSATFSTSPAVPTALTYVGGNATADANGMIRADALVRATPPVDYFKKMMAQVKDTVTGSVQQAQMLLVSGNWEVRFAGLMPGRTHEFTAWATNASGDDGGLAAPVSFTSATNSAVPSAPTSVTAGQAQSKELYVTWSKVLPGAGGSPIAVYVLERNGGSGFTEVWRGNAQSYVDSGLNTTSVYTYRVKVIDQVGNTSGYTASSSITVQKMIDDGYIIAQGVGGGSIANSSINRSRSATGTGSTSGSVASGGSARIGMDYFTFFPNVSSSFSGLKMYGPNALTADDVGMFGVMDDPPNGVGSGFTVTWRNFIP